MLKDLPIEKIPILVIEALEQKEHEKLDNILRELRPYDIALVFTSLPEKDKIPFLTYLSIPTLATMIQALNRSQQLEVLNKLGPEKSAKVLDSMDNDDLADLLQGLSPLKIDKYLGEMSEKESTFLKSLMYYPPETAGRIMTNRFVWARKHYTIREAIEKIKSFAVYAETINYIYVIDENRKLVGVASYRDLLLADQNETLENIMYHRVISVHALTDQEEVARYVQQYDFLAIPVVSDDGILLGIVTFDDIIDVVIQEANEDIEKLSATGKAIDFDTKAHVAAARRLPWLIILLFIGLLSGSIIASFEETLEKVVALAFFMPMIAGMTGNTGTQSLAVVVRGLASTKVDKKTVVKLIMREAGVGVLIGITCGILITIIAYAWQGNFMLGLVVGSSLFLTLIIGTLAGTIIPLILYRLNFDPAVASGPLITTINDIFSLITYFTIASIFLHSLL